MGDLIVSVPDQCLSFYFAHSEIQEYLDNDYIWTNGNH